MISKPGRRFSVVEHHSGGEALTRRSRELAETAEVLRSHRSGCLDLDSSNLTRSSFQYDIHFGAVFVSKVIESDGIFVPTPLPPQFLKHEGLKQLTQSCAIRGECCRVEAEQCAGQARVTGMKLWTLD